ncbi:MAG: hypothetical protein LUG18_07435 [Candidatus Azobacteroides sp.]|nr:hypothetical protein [Candidatus Azobacteroides sp.]
MEAIFFKNIFSTILLILTEGKNACAYPICQLNFRLIGENEKKANPCNIPASSPFVLLSAMHFGTDQESYTHSGEDSQKYLGATFNILLHY